MPRLMISFGFLLSFTVGIGALAITALSSANQRIAVLYQQDMKGVLILSHMATSKMDLARQDRDAMINLDDAAIKNADLEAMKVDFASMHSDLQSADQYFYSPQGRTALAKVRATLDAYESAVKPIMDAIAADDAAAAKAKLQNASVIAAQMNRDIDEVMRIKTALSEEKFQANSQAYQSSRITIVSSAAIALLLGLVLSIYIARGISKPMSLAVKVLEQLSAGDLTVFFDVQTEDEVGRMALALNRAVKRLNDTMQDVADSAAQARSSSQQLAAAAEAIASGAQEQAASLEETSASLEQITAAVRQSADNAQQASQLATGSKDSALQGQDVVAKAITAMSEINIASAKISDIISTIDEIAFQTNLLAVNAAVEAARAGDEGRGFAVVASEVRSLAQRSSVAAKEIKVLIQDSLRKVNAGSGLVNHSGETLQSIVGSVKRVTDIVGEIAAASGEQSSGIEQVNKAMSQMDQVTQSNSAQTEELSATAESLSQQAALLLELVSTFTLDKNESIQQADKGYRPHAADRMEPTLQMHAPLLTSANR